MSTSQSAINARSFHSPSNPRHSKITVEIHRPSRESIQEYNDLLAEANLHAAAAANYHDPFVPVRPPPPPPTTFSKLSSPQSLQSESPPKNIDRDPFAATRTNSNDTSNTTATMISGTSPPPRPSRANTANLNDIFATQSNVSRRRLSDPVPADTPFYSDSPEQQQQGQFSDYAPPPIPQQSTPSTISASTGRSRSGTTTTKSKKGIINFMSDFLNSSKRLEISTPYDPVHLTHVGFNSSTGEFTGLPKEWQQLLQESGISKSDQEKNPQAVMEIVKFYQEGRGDSSVWDKMGTIPAPAPITPIVSASQKPSFIDDGYQNPRAAPPPPKKPAHASSVPLPGTSTPTAHRIAPTPPTPLTPTLDRSTSQRLPPSKAHKSSDQLSRANTTRDRHSPGPGQQPQIPAHVLPNSFGGKQHKSSPGSSTTDLGLKSPSARDPRSASQQQPSAATASLQKAAATAGAATPRRREKKEKDKDKEADIVKRLQQICTDADPTRLYRNLIKIGAGASGGVYTAYQPKKDLIIN
ncbi:Serine/threonine-protein kinase SMU1 [Grifola frondosa]|uniref:non-specific serine/threonine protein kinase n=1 Tax=Grifola frondosa TaxID=5627 RepID=A0A1C7MAV9_GRIFR|nr:Serine/threonine-protein kinase SMU1 [Grifola frondosa]